MEKPMCLKELNEFQERALTEIKTSFKEKEVVLLHGITSSGKTEVYTKLIEDNLNIGKANFVFITRNCFDNSDYYTFRKLFWKSDLRVSFEIFYE